MQKTKAYIKQMVDGRYKFGLESLLTPGRITWSINSWKRKAIAISKVKSSQITIIDLTKD